MDKGYKTLWETQKESKPKAVDAAKELKNKTDYDNLMGFIQFLKDNKMSPRWQSTNKWSVSYRGKLLYHLGINCRYGVCGNEEGWRVSNNFFITGLLFAGSNEYIADGKLKEFIWENIKYPPCVCRPDCKGLQDVTVLGRHYDSICKCWPFSIKNPSEEQFTYLKKWILAIKDFIINL